MKRILVVRTDRVGDVVFITPAIRELRRTFPDAFIATLTQPHTKNILINNPYLNEILTDDLSKDSFWKVVKTIRKYKFTDALLMVPTERAAYQLFFAGINNRVGIGHKLYEIITGMKSVSRNNYIPLRHEADYCMDLARKIGVVTDNYTLQIFVTDKEKEEAVKILEENRTGKNDFKIFLHTGSLGSAPNWSEEKYFQLIKLLLEKYKDNRVKIILTAREMSDAFVSNLMVLDSGRIINLSARLNDLRDMIKTIALADIFIGPSTGPLHIADALERKCIGIHCRRPMSCGKHQGVINAKSVNVEMSEENCRKYCSSDMEVCGIEEGMKVEEILNFEF